MAVDASIFQQLLRPPKSVAEYDAEALKNQQNRLALQFDQTKLDDRTREIADGNKLRQVVSGFGTDQSANYNSLLSAGRLDEAQKYQKTNADIGKTTADTGHVNAQTQETHAKAVNLKMTQVKDLFNTVQSPDQAAQIVKSMYADPDLAEVFRHSGDTPEAAISRIPTDPKAFQHWKQAASLGADKLIEYTTPSANTVASNNTAIATNAATNATSRANNAATVAATTRGQDMTDARTREATRGQVLQTDNGPMLVNPIAGTARAVTGPDGEALRPKLKPLPAPIQKAYMENESALKKVDRALAAVDAYPDALGISNYLGDSIRQRTDPKGIPARALVSDIGSLKIHDRSGAAVTASETPRLQPFIPTATNAPETVKKKLGLFRQEYQSIQNDINANYSREQGYSLPDRKVAAAPAAPKPVAPAAATPPQNSKGWTLHTDAKGNRAYVSPNGKDYEEVK